MCILYGFVSSVSTKTTSGNEQGTVQQKPTSHQFWTHVPDRGSYQLTANPHSPGGYTKVPANIPPPKYLPPQYVTHIPDTDHHTCYSPRRCLVPPHTRHHTHPPLPEREEAPLPQQPSQCTPTSPPSATHGTILSPRIHGLSSTSTLRELPPKHTEPPTRTDPRILIQRLTTTPHHLPPQLAPPSQATTEVMPDSESDAQSDDASTPSPSPPLHH